MNKALLPDSSDYSVYCNVMNINIDFLYFICNLFSAPEVVILFHFKINFLTSLMTGSLPDILCLKLQKLLINLRCQLRRVSV
ncbi:hypothetical protein DV872_04240 [Oceanispirochaeta sp. M1]|nr:hypothetical protein DV872_04240 [Oceanispirochaeta sp. M1]